MIYSKFGSPLTLISKHKAIDGHLSIQATAGDTPDIREYCVGDMKADGGLAEINETVARLPWKVVMRKADRRAQRLRL